MKLIVGLGNPGRRYDGTRHNVGYAVLARLAQRWGVGRPRQKFHGEVLEAEVEGEKTLLLSPTTYMNLSGQSVQAAVAFYKIASDDLLVICDDLNLPLGKLRLRAQGSSGGQKGLADIIRCLGSDNFPRLRIGIGQPPAGREWASFVLMKFTEDEIPVIDEAYARAASAAVDWVTKGLSYSMSQYN